MAEVAETQLEQLQEGVQNWVDTFAANALASSDVFVNVLKNSVGSALQGFEQFQAAAKEATTTAKPATRAAVKKPVARCARK